MLVYGIDSETGGLTPDYSVLSVAAVVADLDTGIIKDEFYSLVKLPRLEDYKVTPKALEINKLSVEECFRKGIPPEQIRDKMLDMWISTGCGFIGGHNIHYDVKMLAPNIFGCSTSEFEKLFTYRYMDSLPVMRLFDGLDNIPSGASLEKTAAALGIKAEKSGLHNALVDIKLTMAILTKFRNAFKTLNLKA